jgi:hypothetical protein
MNGYVAQYYFFFITASAGFRQPWPAEYPNVFRVPVALFSAGRIAPKNRIGLIRGPVRSPPLVP